MRSSLTRPIPRKKLLEFDAQLFQQRNVRLLTPEARVLMALLVGGPLQINSAMQVAGTSSRGFYAVLERLKQANLVNTTRTRTISGLEDWPLIRTNCPRASAEPGGRPVRMGH